MPARDADCYEHSGLICRQWANVDAPEPITMRFTRLSRFRFCPLGDRLMPLRHGKDSLRVETLQADEQTVGVPAAAGAPPALEAGRVGRLNGRIASRLLAPELGRIGGNARAAKAAQLKALIGLGLRGAAPGVLAPFAKDAAEFVRSEVARLGRECGGGICPQNACALVQQAGLAMAGSRAAYAMGDAALGAKLGVEVRQNLLAARELTVLEAKGRAQSSAAAYPWLAGKDGK